MKEQRVTFMRALRQLEDALFALSAAWDDLDEKDTAVVEELPWDRTFCESLDDAPYSIANLREDAIGLLRKGDLS